MIELEFVCRPVILVVAPDAHRDVLVEELSSRYGRDYDLRSAVTFAEALSVVTGVVSEGRALALLAVAPDVGGTSGIDVCTAVHALSPTTRRIVMLESGTHPNSETGERVRAAGATGRVDTYLWTPRGERDEEFHAAITDVLSDWAWTSAPPVVEGIRIVGDAHSPELATLVDFCQRMGLPFRRHHATSAEGAALILQCPHEPAYPLVALPDGSYLVQPTLAQVGRLLWGSPDDLPDDFVADLLVVGAGPAGLAAAVYGASEGLTTVVVEAEAIGGQAGTSSMIRNYLGFPRGISGMRLAQRGRTQAIRFGARFFVGFPAESLAVPTRAGEPFELRLAGSAPIRARTVTIATGSAYRRLGVESVEALVGRGVHYGAAMSIARDTTGRDVYVVGGGNSAGQAAVHLARFARRVTLVIRRADLTATMSDYLIREIEDNPRVGVLAYTEVVDARGVDHLEGLTLRDVRTGERCDVAAGTLLLLLGVKPCVGWLGEEVALDGQGFVRTGRDVPKELWEDGRPPEAYATSVPGLFAVGDVRSGSMKRVASSAGEGAGVVPLVHEYLR